MNNASKISIVIPCYNRENYIKETLESVKRTNYPNWECIVVDNQSTDNSAKIVEEIAKTDDRYTLLKSAKNNISYARNLAINHSNGEYILPLDSDDMIDPNYIKEAIEILELHKNVKVVTCNTRYFGLKKGIWKVNKYNLEDFLIDNSIPVTSIFRKQDYEKTTGFDEKIEVCEDWDFWISLLKTGGDVHKIDKDYFFYRIHEDSTFKKAQKEERLERSYKQIYNKHRDIYDTILLDNPIVLLKQNKKFKKGYNDFRMLTFRRKI